MPDGQQLEGQVAQLLKDYPVIVTTMVAWADMDANLHVNNGAYFRYIEHARLKYFHELGFLQMQRADGIGPILAWTDCRFRRALQYPDTVSIGARITAVERDRFMMQSIVVSHVQEAIAAESQQRTVAFDYKQNCKTVLPERIRQKIEQIEGRKFPLESTRPAGMSSSAGGHSLPAKESKSPMSAAISLKGKVALVTGGGRGIGKAIAKKFAEAGAGVVIASRKMVNLEATAKELSGLPGKIVPVECHVGRMDQLENLVATTENQLGPIDILVNNSATNIGQGPSLEVTDEMIDKMVEINIKAAARLIRLTVPKMIERKTGSVINIASIAGLRPQRGGLLYSFTKAGLIMMTRTWALEFGQSGVRVNAIAPGLIQTDFSEYFWKNPEHMQKLLSQQPIGHLGQPDEIGFAALYLASDEASYVTGQVIVIDGGVTAGSA